MFVAEAMIEAAHKKVKSANTDIVLNWKKTKEVLGKNSNWHTKRGTCIKEEKV